jgi:hypothetical protein
MTLKEVVHGVSHEDAPASFECAIAGAESKEFNLKSPSKKKSRLEKL